MTKRRRGERNWEEPAGDGAEFHHPKGLCRALEQAAKTARPGEVVMVCGKQYILAVDGKLEPVDE
ncbi:hypothetical protein KC887_06595 [Candidatus Kaiserbacteria bacterium]|nr:hypothetical protein [Candidatus Kaiserbacteria bacterium]